MICRRSEEVVREIDDVVFVLIHRAALIPRLVAEERPQIVLPLLVLSLPQTREYRRSIHRRRPVPHHIILVSLQQLFPVPRRAVRVLLSLLSLPTHFPFLPSRERKGPDSEAPWLRPSQHTPVDLNFERKEIDNVVLIFVQRSRLSPARLPAPSDRRVPRSDVRPHFVQSLRRMEPAQVQFCRRRGEGGILGFLLSRRRGLRVDAVRRHKYWCHRFPPLSSDVEGHRSEVQFLHLLLIFRPSPPRSSKPFVQSRVSGRIGMADREKTANHQKDTNLKTAQTDLESIS